MKTTLRHVFSKIKVWMFLAVVLAGVMVARYVFADASTSPPPITCYLSGGQFVVVVGPAPALRQIIFQSSTDLVNWVNFGTNTVPFSGYVTNSIAAAGAVCFVQAVVE
ncbi:MAG: hypothetical protein ABSA12_06195 [Verrucomicrobiia bacterium]|jgi:hypothetical protein